MMPTLLLPLAPLAATLSPAFLPDGSHAEDARHLADEIARRYAYFDEIEDVWDEASEELVARAEAAETDRAFFVALEEFLTLLADDHSFLGSNLAASPRLAPSGVDLWPVWDGERLVVESVRRGSTAWERGIRAGDEIVSVGGRAPAEVALDALHPARDPGDARAWAWAARQCVGGPRDRPLALRLRSDGGERSIEYMPGTPRPAHGPLSAEVIEGNVGVVRVHDGLGDRALIEAFDRALEELRGTRALVLDLRSTPGGGNTTVARAIMGRLVTEERPYQRHVLAEEERAFGVERVWIERVAPRGPFPYEAPVVVLVGRWTGSMGEGLAIGLAGMGRATLVGGRMAGLRGALGTIRLPGSGIAVHVPVERLSTVRAVPREDVVPGVIALQGPGDEDAALAAALRLLGGR
ncbi:MAG: S41 family peptidase [Planctomycetota bacterium]